MQSARKCRFYRGITDRKNYFNEVAHLISSRLPEEQLRKLDVAVNGISYDLSEQLFWSYVDNRYWLISPKDKILEEVGKCIEKYRFLLESNLDSHRIRHLFMRAIMEVISTGSCVFFSGWESHYERFSNRPFEFGGCGVFRFWSRFRKDFDKVCEQIHESYSELPTVKQFKNPEIISLKEMVWKLSDQLLISYSYSFHKLVKGGKVVPEDFAEEFLRRSRWYLENLNQCSSIFLNKYREGIMRELSSGLGMDTNRAYYVMFTFLRDLENGKYRDKVDVSEIIVSCLTEEELGILEMKDAQGNVWNFREQIRDRFYSKYPSFVDREEIEGNIRKRMEEYRPLLREDTVEVGRDTLLDELERECFVSRATYLGNRAMEKNLRERRIREVGKRVICAVDLLLSFFSQEARDLLVIEVDGEEFGLREQLLARWRDGWFATSLEGFRQYLSMLHIYGFHNISDWRNRFSISRMELQSLLEEIDMFFLYPQKGRLVKKLLFRLDTGRTIGNANVNRMMMFYGSNPHKGFHLGLLELPLIFSLALIVYFLGR